MYSKCVSFRGSPPRQACQEAQGSSVPLGLSGEGLLPGPRDQKRPTKDGAPAGAAASGPARHRQRERNKKGPRRTPKRNSHYTNLQRRPSPKAPKNSIRHIVAESAGQQLRDTKRIWQESLAREISLWQNALAAHSLVFHEHWPFACSAPRDRHMANTGTNLAWSTIRNTLRASSARASRHPHRR